MVGATTGNTEHTVLENEKIIVVSGIDSGVGKSVVSGLLARWLHESGKTVITMKMVQTGCSGISRDIIEHRKLANVSLQEEDAMGLTCPYMFSEPFSPHLASRLAGRYIDPEIIAESAYQLAEAYDKVIVEGVGGLFLPLTEATAVIDLIAAHGWRTLLVTTPMVGSINHTRASLAALEARDIPIKGLIYNLKGAGETDHRVIDDTRNVFNRDLAETGLSGRMCDLPLVDCTESYCVDFSPLF